MCFPLLSLRLPAWNPSSWYLLLLHSSRILILSSHFALSTLSETSWHANHRFSHFIAGILLTGWSCLAPLRGPDIWASLTQSLYWMQGAGEEGRAVIRDCSLYRLPLRCSSDWSTAGTHVLTSNAGPGWFWGSCDNQSSCHSGRKCSFTTMWPGAIIYYAFRQRELRQLQHGAAVSAISHHSPSQPFVPHSLRWIITGGTAHFSGESLLLGLSANSSQAVPHRRH